MADFPVFGYRAGISPLHRMDVRCKLIGLGLMNMTTLYAGSAGLLLLTGVIALAFFGVEVSPSPLLKGLLPFWGLLVFVFIARAVSTPGEAVFSLGLFTVTGEGVYSGALFCWRWGLVVGFGLLLVLSTRPAEVKAGVQWFLKPVPSIPERRVAVMLSLMIRLLPLIQLEAREISEAQRARGIENRRNPWFRLRSFSLPLIEGLFHMADQLALAMEARCYTEYRTDPELRATMVDIWKLLWLIGISIVVGLL